MSINSQTGEEYLKSINDRTKQTKLDYDKEELENIGISLHKTIGTIEDGKIKRI